MSQALFNGPFHLVNVVYQLDITLNGNSFGLSCEQSTAIGCCSAEGTYRVYYWEGMLLVAAPGMPLPFPEPTASQGDTPQVFCDPCKNKCTKDGNPLKYNGNEDWLFTTYVNNSPEPEAILINQFTVSKNFNPSKVYRDVNGYVRCGPLPPNATKGVITVNDQSICCTASEPITVYLGPVSKDIKELLKAFKQPKIDTNGDPSEACLCGCPGFCGPAGDDCAGLGQILNLWRSFESENCTIDG